MKIYILLSIMALMSGCTVVHKVDMNDLAPAESHFVVKNYPEDSYPGFMAAEGNIYSCRYGIHFFTEKEFEPPKAEIFSRLMNKYAPGIDSKEVVINRFDVYYNWRLRLLGTAGGSVGGAVGGVIGFAVGEAISDSARKLEGGFVFEDLIVEENPETIPFDGTSKYIGCDGKNEGEYQAGILSGGHDVIVTWINFDVDGRNYSFKTFYQTQIDESGGFADGVELALEKSFQAIGPKIEI